MTDIELLPLPEPDHVGGNDVFGKEFPLFTAEQAESYARAVAEHNVKGRDAEIERLRAERDTVVKEAAKYAERSGRVQAEVDRLRRMVQERDNMLGRRPCAGVNADGKPRCFELVDARAGIEALRAEVERLQSINSGLCRKSNYYLIDSARWQERAERLAEALRELLIDMMLAQSSMRRAAKTDPRWEGCDEAIQPRVDAARAALRDHDQEGHDE